MESTILYPFVHVFELLDELPILAQAGTLFVVAFLFALIFKIIGVVD